MAKVNAKNSSKRSRIMRASDLARLNAMFGRRLRKLRLKKGLTPLRFYNKSGVDGSNLSKYERGEREPGLAIVMIMSRALEVDHRELLDFPFDFSLTS